MSLDRELEPDWVGDMELEEDEWDPDQDKDRDADDRGERLYKEWRDQQMGWDQ